MLCKHQLLFHPHEQCLSAHYELLNMRLTSTQTLTMLHLSILQGTLVLKQVTTVNCSLMMVLCSSLSYQTSLECCTAWGKNFVAKELMQVSMQSRVMHFAEQGMLCKV